MDYHLTKILHGLVTDHKPTKTTKTLIAGEQPMTGSGLDCEPINPEHTLSSAYRTKRIET